ncbi:hypothetical protein BD779DRAFT_411364 [Infundibulicybe gibba]|nr:hypothetical protein BD779DRAFT_411364 [Infundibulicybe gibba]
MQEEMDNARASSASRKRTMIILGVCLTLAGLLLLSGVLFIFLRLRKKNRDRHYDSQDVEPRRFIGPSPVSKPPQAYSLEPVSHSGRGPSQDSTMRDRNWEPGSFGRPGLSSFPSRLVRTNPKAIEAGFALSDFSTNVADSPISDNTTNLMGRNNSATTQTTDSSSRWPMRISVSISESGPRHRDSGMEPPPPYADRASSRMG